MARFQKKDSAFPRFAKQHPVLGKAMFPHPLRNRQVRPVRQSVNNRGYRGQKILVRTLIGRSLLDHGRLVR